MYKLSVSRNAGFENEKNNGQEIENIILKTEGT